MSISLSARTRTEILLQGEDEERLNELQETAARLRKQADELKQKSGQRPQGTVLLTDTPNWVEAEAAAKAAEKAADDFAARAEPRGVKVVLRALGRKRWKQIVDKYPPREGNAGDKVARYNVEEAPNEIVPACLASPALNDEDREAFLDSISDGQFDRLAWLAHEVNRSFGADPTLRLLSASSQTSDETSTSPSAADSAP